MPSKWLALLVDMLDPITQKHPWPLAEGGNKKPNSPDKRLGDGSFGDESIVDGWGSYPKTANAGTDFVWSSQANMRPVRPKPVKISSKMSRRS